MKKILVLTVLAGMGHVRAAEAVCEGIRRVSPESMVWLKDPLEKEPKKQRFINDFYVFMARHIPHLWGYFYNSHLISGAYSPIRWYITKRYAALIAQNIRKFQPEIIVSTHPFLAAAVGVLKSIGTKVLEKHAEPLSPPSSIMGGEEEYISLVSVATDFHVHPFGVNKQVDTFVVPCKEMAMYLKGQGVPSERIVIEGIPISLKFSVPIDTDAAKKQLGFDRNKPIVLILSGGFGIGPVLDLLEAFRGVRGNFQLATIIGKDEKLREKATAITRDFNYPVKIFGFVNNMEEFMSAAAVVITKPGGMSVSEALVKRVPLCLMQAIKGQEEWNARVLVNAGVAVYPKHIKDIPAAVCELLTDEAKYSFMKEAAEKMGKRNCTENIAKLIIGQQTTA
ncbi:glycosyltransferase [Candidatus Desantisbacteria bacterium]|nr:glycosyltransferase [Candidatus Desantisbacteria bacterium]